VNVELQIPDPCLDWLAVARMLSNRADLRDDVVLRVEPDRLRILDRRGETIRLLPPGQWTGTAIHQIDELLDLLSWIEDEFGNQVAEGRFGCPIRGSRVALHFGLRRQCR
jgi:hypothetical protein